MLQLKIVTPYGQFLDVECASVTLPGKLGEMQVLPGHAFILSELISGLVFYQKGDKAEDRFMVGEGFVSIEHDHVNVLCEQARFKSDIDKSLEENLLAELKDQIAKLKESNTEDKRLFSELARCLARLRLLE